MYWFVVFLTFEEITSSLAFVSKLKSSENSEISSGFYLKTDANASSNVDSCNLILGGDSSKSLNVIYFFANYDFLGLFVFFCDQ